MKFQMIAGTIGLAAALTGLAMAAPISTMTTTHTPTVVLDEDLETARGTIKSVNLENDSFVLVDAVGEETTIRVTGETKYTLDGKDATKQDALKAGAKATVKHERNRAHTVDVISSSHE